MRPIDLITPISFDYSKRLADMLVASAKKHKNIVINITTSNIAFSRFSELVFCLSLAATFIVGNLVPVRFTFISKISLVMIAIILVLV